MSWMQLTKEEARYYLQHDEPHTNSNAQKYMKHVSQQTQAVMQWLTRQTTLPFPDSTIQLELFDPEWNAQIIDWLNQNNK